MDGDTGSMEKSSLWAKKGGVSTVVIGLVLVTVNFAMGEAVPLDP